MLPTPEDLEKLGVAREELAWRWPSGDILKPMAMVTTRFAIDGFIAIYEYDPDREIFHGYFVNTLGIVKFDGHTREAVDANARLALVNYLSKPGAHGKPLDHARLGKPS